MDLGSVLAYLGWILAALAGTFAIKATIKFDINEWRKESRRIKIEQSRNLCPHVVLKPLGDDSGKWVSRSTYVKPAGTSLWTCQRCGDSTLDETALQEDVEYWASHRGEYERRMKKLVKLNKKLGG